MAVTTPPHVQQDILTCLLTAESSTEQLTAVLATLSSWLSSLRRLVVSYGDEAAAPLAAVSRVVRRLEDLLTSDLTTLLSHTLSLSLRPTCARRRRHAISSTAWRCTSTQRLTVARRSTYRSSVAYSSETRNIHCRRIEQPKMILAGLDEDPNAVLAARQPSSSSLPLMLTRRVSR